MRPRPRRPALREGRTPCAGMPLRGLWTRGCVLHSLGTRAGPRYPGPGITSGGLDCGCACACVWRRSQWLAGPLQLECTDACCHAFKEKTRLLRKGPQLHAMADAFIRKRLKGGRFVSAHIRPYPDACVNAWTKIPSLGRVCAPRGRID
jgi:hypothetical protein